MKQILIIVAFLFVSLEICLRLFDPWQASGYFRDLKMLASHFQQDSEGMSYIRAGTYPFSNWEMTINPDHTRAVPSTIKIAGCRIAFIGDSVTMGYGVGDAFTWVNLLARHYPRVTFLNAGVVGYNIQQVEAVKRNLPADGYFYLMIDNDAEKMVEAPIKHVHSTRPISLFIKTYLYLLLRDSIFWKKPKCDLAMFDSVISRFKADRKVESIAFEGFELSYRAGLKAIPMWTHNNSFTDRHANILGNQQIAQGVEPHLDRLIRRVCRPEYAKQ